MFEAKKPEFKLKVEAVGETEIHLTRQFRGPKDLVFRCFTEPKLLTQWLGCGMGKTTRCEIDLKIGGLWNHQMDLGAHGLFETFGQTLECQPPNRVVRSYIYNVPEIRESVSTETATFTESNGITHLHVRIRHLCRESRDGHLGSGLEMGAGSSYNQLEEFLLTGIS